MRYGSFEISGKIQHISCPTHGKNQKAYEFNVAAPGKQPGRRTLCLLCAERLLIAKYSVTVAEMPETRKSQRQGENTSTLQKTIAYQLVREEQPWNDWGGNND